MSIGERISKERKRLKLTQAEFALKMGVSLSSQKRFEANERTPSVHYITALAKTGADSVYVISGDLGFVMSGSRNPFEQVAALTVFDNAVSKSLALASLQLDIEGFATMTSTIQSDNTADIMDKVLDALIENSPTLQARLKK